MDKSDAEDDSEEDGKAGSRGGSDDDSDSDDDGMGGAFNSSPERRWVFAAMLAVSGSSFVFVSRGSR